MDSIAVGKPTIEMFRFQNNYKSFLKTQDGYTSVYRAMGIVAPADTREELTRLLKDYFSGDGNNPIWKKQRDLAGSVVGDDDDSSERAVLAMMSMINQ